MSNGGRQPDGGLFGWMALVCWQAEGAQMSFCAPCRYSDQGALLFTGVGIFDTALCTFWSLSGSLHGAAWSVLAERRRNEASSSREGGGRLAVRWWLALGSGCWRGMRAVRAGVSWPARPAGLRKRSEVESSAYEGSFPLNSAYRLSAVNA